MLDKKKIKAVGFDVDGTLYIHSTESTIAISRLVAQTAAKLLGRADDEFVEEYLAAREKYRSNTLALDSFGLNGEEIFQKIIDEFPIEDHVGKDKRLVNMVAELKKRYRLFLISNGTGRQVERKLGILGLDYRDFEPRIYAYDHNWAKPEPAPFLAAIELLGLRPEETVYVGDREEMDVDGAQMVGMKAILVGGESEREDAWVDRVYDILNVL